jgi:hypothetical protein
MGSHLYYSAADGSGLLKLYKTDGTTITQLPETNPGGNEAPWLMAVIGTSLYYTSIDGVSGTSKLYRTDGTSVTQLTPSNDGLTLDLMRFLGVEGAVIGNHFYFLSSPSFFPWAFPWACPVVSIFFLQSSTHQELKDDV